MRCPGGVVTILALGVLLTACVGDVPGSQPPPSIPRQTAVIGDYELRPAAGWHVAGRVTARPAPHGDQLLDIAVVGPDAEVMQRFMWHVAALRCDEWGTFAPQPKRYFPGTTVERSPVFHLEEDRFTDSGRRNLSIAAAPDWTSEPFSVAAFAYPGGKGTLVTCADLPPLS